jgi:hypothetical protein
VQVYGATNDPMRDWCERHGMPLRIFAWNKGYESAGFTRNAAYLVRPDNHVALCDPAGSAESMAKYFRDRAYRRFCLAGSADPRTTGFQS